jgi:hypothetical protein
MADETDPGVEVDETFTEGDDGADHDVPPALLTLYEVQEALAAGIPAGPPDDEAVR